VTKNLDSRRKKEIKFSKLTHDIAMTSYSRSQEATYVSNKNSVLVKDLSPLGYTLYPGRTPEIFAE
jgi:hypothetical protein